MQEFKEQVHERFNVAEGQILDIHKKIEELFVFLKKTQSTAEVLKEAIEKIQNINNVLKSNSIINLYDNKILHNSKGLTMNK